MILKVFAVSGFELFLNDPSMDKYALLCEQDKQVLMDRFNLAFSRYTVYGRLDTYTKLYTAAQKICRTYPKGVICSLGQSPAWLIYLASLLDRDPSRFRHIAFSGAWYHSGIDGLELDDRTPNHDESRVYRQYLSTLSLDPNSVMKRFYKTGSKTFVFEYVVTGCGLESFKHFYKEWLRDLGMDPGHFFKVFSFIIFSSDTAKRSYSHYAATPHFRLAATVLQQLTSNDAYHDRLLPSFPFKRWTKSPCDYTDTNTPLVKFKLIHYALSLK